LLKVTRYWKEHFSSRVLAGIIPLAYATNESMENLAKKFEYFSGKGNKLGVLTPQEAAKLFSIPWKDERVKIWNMIAMITGCHLG
jgi:hypothetical protein